MVKVKIEHKFSIEVKSITLKGQKKYIRIKKNSEENMWFFFKDFGNFTLLALEQAGMYR